MKLFLNIREKGTTILIASHDLELIKRYGSRVIALRQGRVADDLHRVKQAGSAR
jgi:cell division transport system ATP-binding protein